IGYGGILLGAPLIGLLAHTMRLDRALLAVALLVLLIAALAPAAQERGAEPAQARVKALPDEAFRLAVNQQTSDPRQSGVGRPRPLQRNLGAGRRVGACLSSAAI